MTDKKKKMNIILEEKLKNFINAELDDGAEFADILEQFDIDPAEAFVYLFEAGWVDEEALNAYIMDI